MQQENIPIGENHQVNAAANTASAKPWDLQLGYHIKNIENSDYAIKTNIIDLIRPQLKGYGKVDLVEFQVIFKTTASAQTIFGGVGDGADDTTTESFCGDPNGFDFTSNTTNFGNREVLDIHIPDIFTRQLTPPDSRAPAFVFYMKASKGMSINFVIRLACAGTRTINITHQLK